MISSAYNYYLYTYRGQQVSKYDSHKRSELRNVYNRMLKVNKKSPLYKITDTENVQKYAIDLKESARAFKNVASSLTGIDGGITGFLRKKAVSSNTAVVDVKYIGDEEKTDEAQPIEVKVNKLAASQINEGEYLNPSECILTAGEYFFDMHIGEYTYEFSFGVKENDTNESIQDKLVRLFNRSNIGVIAQKVTGEDGNKAIRIESSATGDMDSSGIIFTISDNDKGNGDAAGILGLNNVKQSSSNAEFLVNGIAHTASSNTFSLQHNYQLTLNNVSYTEEGVKIGLKQDIDSIIENVNELVSSYNNIVDLAVKKASQEEKGGSRKLIEDIGLVSGYYKNSLETAGFMVEDDGHIRVEEALLIQAENEGTLDESLEKLNTFKKALVAKADDISINPMKYVDKKLISYPNPVRNFTSPYVSSMYTGMMFNGYI